MTWSKLLEWGNTVLPHSLLYAVPPSYYYYLKSYYWFLYTLHLYVVLPAKTYACIHTARLRLGKHIPANHTHATKEHPFLGNTGKHASLTIEDSAFHGVRVEDLYKFTVRRRDGVQRIIDQQSREFGPSSGDGSRRWSFTVMIVKQGIQINTRYTRSREQRIQYCTERPEYLR
jgi:hypothetical protein